MALKQQHKTRQPAGSRCFFNYVLAGETRTEKSVCSPQARDEMKWQQVTLR